MANLNLSVVIDDEKMEQLKNDCLERIEYNIDIIKSIAIKEFAERLKTELTTGAGVMRISAIDIIDALLKEMMEAGDAGKLP